MIGIIGGTLFAETPLFASSSPEIVKTKHGKAEITRGEKAVFINRHGTKRDKPPHMINHAANMAAMASMGVDRIIAACSVGSLREGLPPGSIVIPNDFISLFGGSSIFNKELRHVIPELSEEMRKILAEKAAGTGLYVENSGVYFQTRGPRLETRAEIRMLAGFADVVGMTMGDEATAAAEAGIEYAAICSVDNYANGIMDAVISQEEIDRLSSKNSIVIRDIILGIVG